MWKKIESSWPVVGGYQLNNLLVVNSGWPAVGVHQWVAKWLSFVKGDHIPVDGGFQ